MISVCIATYNGEKYIRQQLESILQQLSPNDEVIISDDSSEDDTLIIVESFHDNRIKIHRDNHFRSPVYNFEHAISRADGDYIFLSDQDDVWLEGKVEKVMRELEFADIVVTDCAIVDDDLNILIPSYFKENHSGPGLIRNLLTNSYFGCCMAFRKELIHKILPFPKKLPMHDIWIGFVGDIFFKPVFLPHALIFHRRHDSNASSTTGESTSGITKKVSYRWNLIRYFPMLLMR